ncbi:MAG: TPM domain-containing protein [Elusimicrobia bacterium]|nr:TPM domain-containing protein [Elusimicrobiota bacterium]
MVNIRRWVKHFFHPPWALRHRFSKGVLKVLGEAIRSSEKKHAGEIRFVVEATLPFRPLAAGQSPRERAVDLFSRLRVWDTEHNNGVLIYVLLADRDVEILADRGLNKRISPAEWESVCRSMEAHFRKGDFENGSLAGIDGATQLLARHFPPQGAHPNELPDTPAIL